MGLKLSAGLGIALVLLAGSFKMYYDKTQAEIESFQRGSFNSGKAAVLDGEVSPISVTRSQSSSDGVASPIATTRSRSSTVKWFSSLPTHRKA